MKITECRITSKCPSFLQCKHGTTGRGPRFTAEIKWKAKKKFNRFFFFKTFFFREHALFLTHGSHRIEWEHSSTTNLVVAENWSRQSLHCTQVKFFKKHSSAVAISNTTECEWRFCVTWTVLWIPNSKCSIRYQFCLKIFDINILAFLWSSTAPPLFWWFAFLQYFYLSLLISSVFWFSYQCWYELNTKQTNMPNSIGKPNTNACECSEMEYSSWPSCRTLLRKAFLRTIVRENSRFHSIVFLLLSFDFVDC